MNAKLHILAFLGAMMGGGLSFALEGGDPATPVDPFAGVVATPEAAPHAVRSEMSFWTDNLQFRRELYFLSGQGMADGRESLQRYSAGFEIQKRVATEIRTLGALDYQGRVVYRDQGPAVSADPMAHDQPAWVYETHNAYADGFNVAGEPGRVNLRAGYFYQPFGLNTQTDTHGTLLQLSNEQSFGVERDWQTTFYGNLSSSLDYQAGYLLGTAPDHTSRGQGGLGVGRIALNNEWLFQQGLEGGISVAVGERAALNDGGDPIDTRRVGIDVRKRHDALVGPVTLTIEEVAGTDDGEGMWSSLAQVDWRNPGRRWGTAIQHFYSRQQHGDGMGARSRESLVGMVTRYFRNDVGNSSLHWVAVGVECPLRTNDDVTTPVAMVQYYRYW